MLPKKDRLAKKEIEAIKSRNLPVIQGQYFGLIFQPVEGEQKFGLIVSARVAKKAVSRNRVKRRLFWAIKKTCPTKEGWFLFLAKKASLEGTVEDFSKELLFFEKKI